MTRWLAPGWAAQDVAWTAADTSSPSPQPQPEPVVEERHGGLLMAHPKPQPFSHAPRGPLYPPRTPITAHDELEDEWLLGLLTDDEYLRSRRAA